MPLTIEHEGKEITVYTQEDLDKEVTGLKVTNQKLKEEKKAASDAVAEAKEAARVAAEEKAKADGDYQKLMELQEQRQTEAAEKFNKLTSQIKAEKVGSTLNGLVAEFGAGGTKNEDLRDLIKSRYNFDYDNESGQVVVSGDNVSSLEDLQKAIKTSGRYDAYIAGNNANGGGSTGNSGSGASTGKKFNELSGAELKALRESDPDAYERLKSEFYS